jgi:hypothetical protein
VIISTSSINLTAEHTFLEEHKKSEKLITWKTGLQPQSTTGTVHRSTDSNSLIVQQEAVRVEVSLAGRTKPRFHQGLAEKIAPEDMPIADLKIRILKALIERLTGKKIDIADPARHFQQQANQTIQSASPDRMSQNGGGGSDEQGWGIIYEYHESHYEHEQTTLSADGIIVTEDGRELSFQVQLTMSREFYNEHHLSIRAGDALKDPLVVNFAGAAAALSDTSFRFDIDHDGTAEHIRFVAQGSGFLALDHNEDGIVNNGGELFGAMTGEGFAELQHYDADRNGWIDENDAIYDRLRIWTRDESGNSQLFSLGQKGIGAIYLDHVTTPFSLKDEMNNLQGQVRSTGLFIFENGSAGTVQQIDLAV